MSSLYNLEPQPTAKVILHTSSGDILLELFAQQTPKTSRNFLQLCLDGYYDNTIFHRLVPGFIVQGGDPTGTGAGGESSFEGGQVFEDEFHSRLKFNRRGLLGMANSGEKNDNGSQFFLTLGVTPELTGRNTMFGRVEGDTIFNLVKIGEADLVDGEGSERPMYPTKVIGTEILVNPFEGMVGRVRVAVSTSRQDVEPKKRPVKKKAAKQLLSFGGEDGDDGDVVAIKAAAKFNPKLVTANGALPPSTKRPAPTSTEDRAAKRRLASPSPPPNPTRKTTPPPAAAPPPSRPTTRISPSPPPAAKPVSQLSLLETTNAQIAALKSSLKRNVPTSAPVSTVKKSTLEAMIPSTSTRGRKRKGNTGAGSAALSRDEQRTVDEFNEFRRRLDAVEVTSAPTNDIQETKTPISTSIPKLKEAPPPPPEDSDEEAHLCDLHFIAHCQSCSKWDNEDDGTNDNENHQTSVTETEGTDWMTHQLSFAKDRLGKDLEWKRQNERELVVIDPREREREIVGKSKGRGGDGGKRGGRAGMARGGVEGSWRGR